jgi:GTP-binding protein
MTLTVAIVGRPNVGKSTLFNRLVGKRLALVDDTPGVTRDRREGEGRLFDLRFRLFDTAGLEDVQDESLEGRMRRQSERAIEEADLVLLMVDARTGLTSTDEIFADQLRRSERPVVVLANKCEGRAGEAGLLEAYSLGLGDPVAFSAEHGLGLEDLYDHLKTAEEAETAEAGEGVAEPGEKEPDVLQFAIVGRPNVGKSTLINRLLDEERLLTGPEAGITRDSISVEWSYKDRPIRLIDTAGMRRKARVSEKLEKLAVADALRAVQYAHVVVLLLDAEEGLERQDLTIANHTIEEGRALVIAINKWDVVKDRDAVIAGVRDRLQRSLPQVKGIPVVTVSGLKGRNLDGLLDAAIGAYDIWNTKVATPDLNRWLHEVEAAHPPPMAHGRRNRLKYISQPKARPPTFTLFCAQPKDLPDSYLRYLENELRHDFELPGTPIRFLLRKSRNPYA